MALYSYQAYSRDGKKVQGIIDAPSMGALKEQLTKQGLFPIKIEPAQEGGGFFSRLFSGRVSLKEKILFTKQFAILLKSGVPLMQACELLIEQFTGSMRTILVRVKDDIKEGGSLADSLAKYPKVFETLYIQLVRAGEATGKLDTILVRLASYLEKQAETRKKISGALQMPIIQFVMAVGVVSVLMIYVVPGIAENLTSSGKALPAPTQFVMAASNFMVNYFLFIIIGVAAIIALFMAWKKTSSGARIIDTIKLRLPLIKYLARTNAVVQFCYTLGLLLEGGVHLAEALDIVVAVIDNRVLADELRIARDNIVKEGKIAQYLKQTNMFPPIAIYLIQTGEQTGELDTMLLTVADNYEKDYLELIDRITTLIGPVMLVAMGGIVGFIIISIIMPIMEQANIEE